MGSPRDRIIESLCDVKQVNPRTYYVLGRGSQYYTGNAYNWYDDDINNALFLELNTAELLRSAMGGAIYRAVRDDKGVISVESL